MKPLSCWVAGIVILFTAQTSSAQPKTIVTFSVDNAGVDGMPTCLPLSVPEEFAKVTNVELFSKRGNRAWTGVGQLTAPSLVTEKIPPAAKGMIRRDLHFTYRSDWQGGVAVAELRMKPPDHAEFAWKSKPGEFAELSFDDVPMLRYVHKAYDNSSPAARDKTYKVFHHLYDPTGMRFITNGGDTNIPMPKNPKDNLYPHHRGLMYAFNSITFDGKEKCDTWHAKPGDTHQSHEGFLATEAGAVLGRHRVAVDWHGPKKQVFAKEEREMTVYKMGQRTLVEFASRLKTTGGLVKLQGDPQHAGFQFRAHNDVHEQKNDKLTYYLRPDGKGKLGDTRNWDPKKGGPVNLPWDAGSFMIGSIRYTVAYLNHPTNPGQSRWSERDYARFGCYFEYDLTEKNPLVVNYRVWLQDGEMTVDQVNELYKAFTQPPKVTIK
ncbi:MAG TPA: DUF6807 family protein [Gemmataceae bacterium]|nr:DUF6807 family protein [Gemmataceae bacterium]